MPKKFGLTKQLQMNLDSKLKIGHSKHEDKKLGITSGFIYSWSTYRSYLKHGCYFLKWAKSAHHCETIEAAREFVDEFLQIGIDRGLSPYTQKLQASALAKIYGCSANDFIKTGVRHRANIIRSRGEKSRDKHFSEKKNQDLVNFCRATGLRRSEITTLRKKQLVFDEKTDSYFLDIKGKGGRKRLSPILTEVFPGAIDLIINSDGRDGRVFPKIHGAADIHSYRAEYCTSIYKKYARPIEDVPKSERYCCKIDLRGIIYDKKAMKIASQALGHNRISVIAEHYIRPQS